MFRLLVATFLTTVASTFECGKVPIDNPLESRVVGGHAAAGGNWPFVVKLFQSSSISSCTGSLIGHHHVLTAAHCVDDTKGAIPESINASDFEVLVSTDFREAIWLEVQNIFTAPRWRSPDNDIAIVELKEPIEYTDYAQPICLPRSFRERPGDSGYFVGWGRTNKIPEPHSDADYTLLWPAAANENLMTFRRWSDCRSKRQHREDYICIGQYMRHIHDGDSGGPLMVNRKGIWFQVGVVSTGKTSDGRGDEEFVRVTTHCKWIKSVTHGEVKCGKI